MGNGEDKELIVMTHRHELSGGECTRGRECAGLRGIKEKKNETTVIAYSIKYT